MIDILITCFGYFFIFGIGFLTMVFGALGASLPAHLTGIVIMFVSGFLATYDNMPRLLDVNQPLITLSVLNANTSLTINFIISIVFGLFIAFIGYQAVFGKMRKRV